MAGRAPASPLDRDRAARLATLAIARAHRRLRSTGDRNVAVHDARRAIRRVRALLALLRPALGAEAYENARGPYRAASHALSRLRDAQTAIETLDRAGGKPKRLRAALERARDARLERAPEQFARVHALLDVALLALPGWLAAGSRGAWREGLADSRSRASRALDQAREKPTRTRAHRLRRRMRDLAVQLELCGRKTKEQRAIARTAKALGRERDLWLLQRETRRRLGDERRVAAIRKKRKKLRRDAIRAAGRMRL